jgi:hypothetical protein
MDPALHPAAQQHAQQPIVWKESSQQGNKFMLPDYYAVIRQLGAGAYGVVCHAIDTTPCDRHGSPPDYPTN